MAKEVPTNASSAHEVLDDSRISNMPDEVLVSILSLLTINEAARTSVLSRRWVNLWTCFNGSLNFDASQTMYLLYLRRQFYEEEQSTYVCWVNRVLNSLDNESSSSSSSSILDEFRVCFDLRNDSTPFIDKWIQFCMEKKRVRRLEINFKPVCCSNNLSTGYTFPVDYFYHHIKQHPRGLYSISELTSLSLKHVGGVSGQLVACFLSNCPLLERLCVVSSDHLLNLKVAVVLPQELKLKYLKLLHNRNLQSVEISDAPNLVSLRYYGKRIEVHVENVPRLIEVSFTCCPYEGRSVINMFCSISRLFSQLETLELNIHLGVDKPSSIPQFLQLTELKHLVLKVTKFKTRHLPEYEESLLEWMSLVDASPRLNRFTLQWSTAATFSGRKLREVLPKCTHQCLKVVELLGFVGCEIDVEVAMYMFANANTLDKFIVDCRHPYFFGKEFREKEQREKAKKRAMDLIKILPSGVEQLVVI